MSKIHVAINSRCDVSALDDGIREQVRYTKVENPEVIEMRLTYDFWDRFPLVPDTIESIKREMKYNGFDRLLDRAGITYTDEEIQKTNLEAMQECHLAVAVKKVRPLVEELRRRGVTPKLTSNDQYSYQIEQVAKQLGVEFLE